jgi:hypothetical protein
MMTLVRCGGGLVLGWLGGSAFGLAVSRVYFDGRADQLPILTAPTGALVGLLVAFALRRWSKPTGSSFPSV